MLLGFFLHALRVMEEKRSIYFAEETPLELGAF